MKHLKNIIIVLDLDETLIYTPESNEKYYNNLKMFSSSENLELRKRIFQIKLIDTFDNDGSGTVEFMWTIKRPHLDEFLKFCFKYFKAVIVWSAGVREYVTEIVKNIFTGIGEPLIVYNRSDLDSTVDGSIYYKPLTKMIRQEDPTQSFLSLKNLLILDDKIYNFIVNKDNGVLIPGYYPKVTKKTLMKDDVRLLEFMKWLKTDEVNSSNDVRKLNKKNIFSKKPNLRELSPKTPPPLEDFWFWDYDQSSDSSSDDLISSIIISDDVKVIQGTLIDGLSDDESESEDESEVPDLNVYRSGGNTPEKLEIYRPKFLEQNDEIYRPKFLNYGRNVGRIYFIQPSEPGNPSIICSHKIQKSCPTLEFKNIKQFVIRAGIIPYYVDSNKTYFLLGNKKTEGSATILTDFGGGCSRNETPIVCSEREMMEETRKVVDVKIKNATHIYITGTNRPHQAIFLVPIDQKDDNINRKFLNKPARSISEKELESISWVSYDEFIKLPPHKLDQSLLSLLPLLPKMKTSKSNNRVRALQPRKRSRIGIKRKSRYKSRSR